ncbi:hypothetical protein [Paenibacillus alkalitolerans]|uniref:hypothetical protein n=1 Tax=Paenibacillus alkalitolerans TaxID=2799335 RepID=UPI0018F62381|nr:hypothetical protein [Paenibacillus alkalitolerans]
MHVQHPVTENQIPRFVNKHVCAVLHDGSHHYGTVTGCERGKLILNGHLLKQQTKAETLKKKAKKRGARISVKQDNTAKTAAIGLSPAQSPAAPLAPYIPPAEYKAIELEKIALLFALFP